MVFANTLEPLRAARNLPTGPKINWEVATTHDQPVKSSSEIIFTPSIELNAVKDMDYLVLICGYGVRRFASQDIYVKIQRLRKSSRYVIGIDAGAWLMASMGFMTGHKATIHWQMIDEFEESFPDVICTKRRFTQSGPYITCGAASSALSMILTLIGDQFGPAVKFDVSNLFNYDVGRQSEFDEIQSEGETEHIRSIGSLPLRSAVDTMLMHIEYPISLSKIASINSISVRSLNRLFLRELQLTPGKYYQLLRLTRARDIAAETTKPISEIALLTGFSSPSSLSRAFSAHYKMRIRDIRKAYSNN